MDRGRLRQLVLDEVEVVVGDARAGSRTQLARRPHHAGVSDRVSHVPEYERQGLGVVKKTVVALGSIPVLEAPEDGADLVTEVVAGEELEIHGHTDGFLKIVVPEHRTSLDPRGYPGWIRRGSPVTETSAMGTAVMGTAWSPDLLVVSPLPDGLPLGAKLESRADEALLPDGSRVTGGVAQPALKWSPGSVLKMARALLGLPYRWGGTDSTRGMDCSGMVYRILRVHGITVPRDADEQYEAATFKSQESWKAAHPGDLVFFGEASITHVGFHLGDGHYISEHGVGETVIRGMNQDPYLGHARYR